MLLLVGQGMMGLQAQSYAYWWSKIEEAEKKSLPQTVIHYADLIAQRAEQEQIAGQLFKALLWKEHYQQALTPDSLMPALRRWEQCAWQEEDGVNRALWHAVLATCYAQYWQAHQWTIGQRTDLLPEEASDDITTWTNEVFKSRIDRHLQASLQENELLVKANARDYVPLVLLHEGSLIFQHDLFHLLCQRAIDYYWRASGDEKERAKQRGLLRQRMRETYRKQGNEDALFMIALDELRVESKNRPVETLQRIDSLMTRYDQSAWCAEAYLLKAEKLMEQGDAHYLQALKVCEEGLKRFPNYSRIKELTNVKRRITHPEFAFTMDNRLYPADSLKFRCNYRNVSQVRIHIYETPLKEYPLEDGIGKRQAKEWQGRRCWSSTFTLPLLPRKGTDAAAWTYMQMEYEVSVMPNLTEGVYLVELQPEGLPAKESCRMLLAVTRLQMLFLPLPEGGREVAVVDWKSGQPVEGARIRGYSRWCGRPDSVWVEVKSDAEGRALLPQKLSIDCCRVATSKDAALPAMHLWGAAVPQRKQEVREVVTLLTDRSVYRPGQTLYVKGIAYQQREESAQVSVGRSMELTLLDANRKEVGRKSVVTNDFGSFATSFILPNHLLNGLFTIRTSTGHLTTVRVEEYKRPSFEISFLQPEVPYTWGDSLSLSGRVMGYQGVPLQQATVSYRIHLNEGFYWRGRQEVPLKQDTVYTDKEGYFRLPLQIHRPQRNGSGHLQVEVTVVSAYGETAEESYALPLSDRPMHFISKIDQIICKEDSLAYFFGLENSAGVALQGTGSYRLFPMDEQEQTDYAHPAHEGTLHYNKVQQMEAWRNLPSGRYRMVMACDRKLSHAVQDSLTTFILFSRKDRKVAAGVKQFIYRENVRFDEQHPAVIWWGTCMPDTYLYWDMLGVEQRLEHRVEQVSDTLMRIEIPYRKEYGTGAQLSLCFVKEGELYQTTVTMEKRQERPSLQFCWEVMRDRLLPGQQEEWRLTIKNGQLPAEAELLALMYDASLDQIAPHHLSLAPYWRSQLLFRRWNNMHIGALHRSASYPLSLLKVPGWRYDELTWPRLIRSMTEGIAAPRHFKMMAMATKSEAAPVANGIRMDAVVEEDRVEESADDAGAGKITPEAELRTQFNETAFFYPQLHTDSLGQVVMHFVAPQSLTRWNFIGLAHTREMQTGSVKREVVTAKEFMLQPALPRFLRVGDETEVKATVTNLTAANRKGVVRLQLFDPMTERVILTRKQAFQVAIDGQQVVTFRLTTPQNRSWVGLRMVAESDAFSDGEQHLLPILSDEVYLTETLPFVISGQGKRTYSLDSLFNRRSSKAKERNLTLELTGNPAWYAVMALPSVEMPTNDNAISWTAALYSTALAKHIVSCYPAIELLFARWRENSGKEGLFSRLQQNSELKELLLNETPWVMEAEEEGEQQRRVANFFETNRVNNQLMTAQARLLQLQRSNGSWSWFSGMGESRYVTIYVLKQLYRLHVMTQGAGSPELKQISARAMNYLHTEAYDWCKENLHQATSSQVQQPKEAQKRVQQNREIQMKGQQERKQKPQLPSWIADYLYLTALGGEEVPVTYRKSLNYLLALLEEQAFAYPMASKAHAAVVLMHYGHQQTARTLLQSIKEHLTTTEEMGAHFDFAQYAPDWGMNRVSTHVACMEALSKAGGEEALIEQMKVWLLRQKQTRQWRDVMSTTDAVYALLMQGENLLASRGEVVVTIGKERVTTQTLDAVEGLAYIKRNFTADSSYSSHSQSVINRSGSDSSHLSVKQSGRSALEARSLEVEKRDEGMAWGALYARYRIPLSEVKATGQGMEVEKQLYVEQMDESGKRTLRKITAGVTSLKEGDKVVARLVCRLSRPMDFVQITDARGACFEPLAARSGYRLQGGYGCYTEVKDAATHFFFAHLPKGELVVEHTYRVVRAGIYQAGMATIQCAYSPEYAAHSSAQVVKIGK